MTAPCRKCQSEIDEAAVKCPECGYEPSSAGAGWFFGQFLVFALAITGVLFTVTIVGAIVGIPMILAAAAMSKSLPSNEELEQRMPTTHFPDGTEVSEASEGDSHEAV